MTCVYDDVTYCMYDDVTCVYDDVTCVYDDVTYCMYDYVTCVYDDVTYCMYDDVTYYMYDDVTHTGASRCSQTCAYLGQLSSCLSFTSCAAPGAPLSRFPSSGTIFFSRIFLSFFLSLFFSFFFLCSRAAPGAPLSVFRPQAQLFSLEYFIFSRTFESAFVFYLMRCTWRTTLIFPSSGRMFFSGIIIFSCCTLDALHLAYHAHFYTIPYYTLLYYTALTILYYCHAHSTTTLMLSCLEVV